MQYYYICGMVVSIFSKVQSSMRVHCVFTILSFQGKSLDCNKAYIAYHFRIYDMRIGLKRKINGFRSRFSLLFAPGTHRLFYVVQGCKREGNWRKRKAKSSSAILYYCRETFTHTALCVSLDCKHTHKVLLCRNKKPIVANAQGEPISFDQRFSSVPTDVVY